MEFLYTHQFLSTNYWHVRNPTGAMYKKMIKQYMKWMNWQIIVWFHLKSSTSSILLCLHFRSIHYLLKRVRSSKFDHPPGFANRENKTRCYLNSTFQHLYFNVLFRELVFKIYCYTMLNGLKRESQHFAHNFQKIVILRELQKCFGEIYLRKKNNIH